MNDGEHLRKFLHSNKLKVKDLAEEMEISAATVSIMLKKERFTLKLAKRVSSACEKLGFDYETPLNNTSVDSNTYVELVEQLSQKDKVINQLLSELEFVRLLTAKSMGLQMGKGKVNNCTPKLEVVRNEEDITCIEVCLVTNLAQTA